jgi:hypothetical protein
MNRCTRALGPILLAAGCGIFPTGPADSVLTETIGMEFTLRERVLEIPFHVTNRSSSTIYLAACGDRVVATIERRQGVRWEHYEGDWCPANVIHTLALAAGHSREDRHRFWRPEPGSYRLRLGIGYRSQPAQWVETSNPFVVR